MGPNKVLFRLVPLLAASKALQQRALCIYSFAWWHPAVWREVADVACKDV